MSGSFLTTTTQTRLGMKGSLIIVQNDKPNVQNRCITDEEGKALHILSMKETVPRL